MTKRLVRSIAFAALAMLGVASTKPSQAGDEKRLVGTYKHVKRVSADGKEVADPDVLGYMTFTKTRRTVMMKWNDAEGQPVSLAYTRLDGMPMGRSFRPFFAWYGDMALPSHLWRMLGMGVVTAEVTFHEPVTIDGFSGRKAMADHCWRIVSEGVATLLVGRPQRHAPVAAGAAALPAGAAAPAGAPM